MAVRGGPDPHFHRSISESFYVLSGTISLFDGSSWVDGTPGDFLYVPQGGVHGFRNESGEPASMLILFTPGAPREDYFERVHTTAADEPRGARGVLPAARHVLGVVVRPGWAADYHGMQENWHSPGVAFHGERQFADIPW